MDLKQLKYFIACVEVGSFSEAAKTLYTTQSSVSKVIKALVIKTKTPCPTLPRMLANPFFIIFDTSVDLTNMPDEGLVCTGPLCG